VVSSTAPNGRVRSDGDVGPQLAQSVERALTILESFSSRRPELGVQELARALDTSPSTVSRLLAALENRGYVAQDDATGRFRLGSRALELGYRFADTDGLMIHAAPHVDALARQLKLTTELYVLDGNQMIRYMTAHSPPGQGMLGGSRFYPYRSAAGKILLAHLSTDVLATLISGDQSGAQPTLDELKRSLASARQGGYASDDEHAGIGKRSLAVPVRDASSEVVAALSVSGPVSRLSDRDMPSILEVVFDRAYEFSKSLGFRPHQALCDPAP